MRDQFHHVIDVAPTFLELARLPHPLFVHGVGQKPIEGASMAYSFNDAAAAERHETQYFETLGNRGIYNKGWTAVTAHNPPDPTWPKRGFDDDVWELYDTTRDWTQAHDLASSEPEKLEDLKRQFLIEAAKYDVLPLDDRVADMADPDRAGRPVLATGPKQRLFPGIGRLNAFSVLNIKNKSHHITAEVTVPESGAEGVIVAQGGLVGGWVIYAKQGRLKYCYNFYGIDLFHVESSELLPAGTHLVRMEFEYDGGGPANGGTVTLHVDHRQVGDGRVRRTQPLPFASDEPFEIGTDGGSPVTFDYSWRDFTGQVSWVEIEIPRDERDSDRDLTAFQRAAAAFVRE